MQHIQNAAARVLNNIRKIDHIYLSYIKLVVKSLAPCV